MNDLNFLNQYVLGICRLCGLPIHEEEFPDCRAYEEALNTSLCKDCLEGLEGVNGGN